MVSLSILFEPEAMNIECLCSEATLVLAQKETVKGINESIWEGSRFIKQSQLVPGKYKA